MASSSLYQVVLNEDDKVPGFTVDTITLSEQDTIGASGDVFNHLLWRLLMQALWLLADKKKLFNLFHLIFFRGREFKLKHKGKTVQTIFQLPLDSPTRKSLDSIIPAGQSTFNLRINVPRDVDNVKENCLTLERFKCIVRTIVSSYFLTEQRFPATSEANGYANIARSLYNYEKNCSGKKTLEEQWPSEVKRDFELWSPIMTIASTKDWSVKLSALAVSAGSVSTKEVYLEDEKQIPGTIWWTGVNAMMTDTSNKIKAQHAIEQKRILLENSNFFGDFKKKLAARGLTSEVNGNFINFLQLVKPVINIFLMAVSHITVEESSFIDEIITSYNRSKIETRTSKPENQQPVESTSTEIPTLEISLSDKTQTIEQQVRTTLTNYLGAMNEEIKKKYIKVIPTELPGASKDDTTL